MSSKKIVLTGRPGVGKTTIVKNVVKALGGSVLGFWTEEIRDPEGVKRIGFSLNTTEGERIVFSSVNIVSPFKVGKYGVDVLIFEKHALPLLKKAKKEKKSLIVIDEIGKMELFSNKFAEIAEKIVFECENPFLGTIPSFDVHPLVHKIRNSRKVTLFHVSERTRAYIGKEILMLFTNLSGSPDTVESQLGS
ncbi:MAG: NTPase [Desulfobacterota bacterium]|nr:NTPase [Thermodesulfobacteriota bacterium]MDW8001545.1 NTPase [Deltaproteobacteria bacterium]